MKIDGLVRNRHVGPVLKERFQISCYRINRNHWLNEKSRMMMNICNARSATIAKIYGFVSFVVTWAAVDTSRATLLPTMSLLSIPILLRSLHSGYGTIKETPMPIQSYAKPC